MPLDPEEDLPRRKSPQPRDLARLSIEELEAYVAEMKAEIARAEQQMAAKRSVRDAADALFKHRG